MLQELLLHRERALQQRQRLELNREALTLHRQRALLSALGHVQRPHSIRHLGQRALDIRQGGGQ